MATNSNLGRLNAAIAKAIAGMKPPERLTVSEWADKKRRLSSESSAEVGPWRTRRTPYLKDIMDSFTDSKVKRITVVASSQVGKSECINNMIGYVIDQDPGSILFIQPNNVDAKEYSILRIAPMIRDCPALKSKVSEAKSRDSKNTILQKQYPGGILTMCGSLEAHALASKPIRYVFGDERDRWATSAGTEGDPWSLATARQITFYNSKAVEVSTPTVKSDSKIAAAYDLGTKERYKSQCPHCGGYHEIEFNDIRFEYEEIISGNSKIYNVFNIFYVCPECRAISTEIEMKHQPAKWEAENPDAYELSGHRSFWLTSLVSPWATWESTIKLYLEAIGDTAKMQVVYNTRLGLLWENRGDIESEESIMNRRENYAAELPDGVLCLTCGVDTQNDRLEYEVVGWGHFGESWGIRKGIIMGRPDTDEVWQALDDVIGHIYRFENGIGLRISMTFVDEGGNFTQEVRIRCREREGKMVFAIKGRGGSDVPYTSPPKKQKIVVHGKFIGLCNVFAIGVDAGKTIIMDNLKVQKAGPKYCHFPLRDEYGPAYFRGLLSEHLVYKPHNKNRWQWEKIQGHERNEALDCRNYAQAAVKALSPDFDMLDIKIKSATPSPNAANTVTQRKAAPTKKQGHKHRSLEDHYNDW